MRKNILAAAIMAAAILCTACGNGAAEQSEAVASETTSSAATETSSAETAATMSAEDAQKLSALSAQVDFAGDAALCAKVEGFAEMSARTDMSKCAFSDSLTKKAYESLSAADSFYVVLKSEDSCSIISTDGTSSNITVFAPDTATIMLVINGVARSFNPMDKTGYSITLDEETNSSFDKAALASMALPTPANDGFEVKTCEITVDGKAYTYELFTTYAYLFDGDRLVMRCDASGNFAADVRENQLPDGIFTDPEGYSVVDYDSLIAAMNEASESAASESQAAAETAQSD